MFGVERYVRCLVEAGAPEDFYARTRTVEYTNARSVISERMFNDGMTLNQIGSVIHRTHPTVYYIKSMANVMSEMPNIYPEFNELKCKFNKLLDEYED